MAEYTVKNPQFIANGFIRAGITADLDGIEYKENEKSVDEDITEVEGTEYEDNDECQGQYPYPEPVS